MLSETARRILGLIAEGRSYDQILQQHPELTYFDIFAAAREALELVEAAPVPILDTMPRAELLLSPVQSPIEASPSEPSSFPELVPDGVPLGDEPSLPAPAPKRQSFIERARATHARAFARWSRDEDAELEQLFRAGMPRSEIARQLDRHDGAIERRLEKFGLIAAPERPTPRARHDRHPSGPKPAETPGKDEPPLDQPVVPGWDLFRDRLSSDPPAP